PALAGHHLCRAVSRHLGTGSAVLAVFRAAPLRSDALTLGRGHRCARPQRRRVWRRGGSGRHRFGEPGPMGSGHRTQPLTGADASPHHPASGACGHDSALGQPVYRAAQSHLAGVADHAVRSRVQGATNQPEHAAHRRSLWQRSADLPGDVGLDHGCDARAGNPRRSWLAKREGRMNKLWDWAYAWEILPLLTEASVITIKVTLMGFVVALIVGLVFAIGRMAGPMGLRWA